MARLLVTFVGLPGTGKTTLCCRVVQVLHRRGVPCDQSDEVAFRRLRHKLVWAVREALGHPAYALRSVWAIAATRQRSLVDLAKMIANWLARSFLIRRAARTPGIHLFDEGLFQALWSIGFSASKESWGSSLPAPLLPAPGLTIVLEGSLATVARRLADRPGCSSRLEKWFAEEPDLLTKAEGVLRVIQDGICRLSAQQPGLHVLVIDNDRADTVEANAFRIADYIQALCHGGGVTAAGPPTPRKLSRHIVWRPGGGKPGSAGSPVQTPAGHHE